MDFVRGNLTPNSDLCVSVPLGRKLCLCSGWFWDFLDLLADQKYLKGQPFYKLKVILNIFRPAEREIKCKWPALAFDIFIILPAMILVVVRKALYGTVAPPRPIGVQNVVVD